MKKLLMLTALLILSIILLDTPSYRHNINNMAFGPLSSFINSITGNKPAPKTPVTYGNTGQYVSPYTNKPTNIANIGGSGLLSTSSYLNPAATPNYQSYAQPLADPQASASYASGGASGGSGGSGGSSTSAPVVDTSALQQQARDLIGQIQTAYHSIQGKINPVVQDQVNQYLQNYNTQQQGLDQTYGNSVGQTQNLFGARGLQDSSFLGNALDQGKQTYSQNVDAINQDKQSKLGAIGQYAQGLTSSADNAANSYNDILGQLGSYDPTSLGTLVSGLQTSLPTVQSQASGMGTNQDFLNTLNQYAPQANQGASQIAGQLQKLVTSSAPVFAKNQIASGLIKSSQLTDPNAQSYWQNYYQNLLSGA